MRVREALAAVHVAHCEERWYQGGHQDAIASIYRVENVNVFDKFAESMVGSIQSIFPASTSATEGVREKLLSAFHTK